MKILIIGDKPSKLNVDPNVAFVGAKCYPRLLNWLDIIGIRDYELINSHTPELMQKAIDHTWLRIAVGIKASQRLSKAGLSHIRLPHPSGLNRQINNKELIHRVLESTRKKVRRYETLLALTPEQFTASFNTDTYVDSLSSLRRYSD